MRSVTHIFLTDTEVGGFQEFHSPLPLFLSCLDFYLTRTPPTSSPTPLSAVYQTLTKGPFTKKRINFVRGGGEGGGALMLCFVETPKRK